MTPPMTGQETKSLRELLSSAIAGEKSYHVPNICRRYGLAGGSEEEAFRSKFKYVFSRTASLDKADTFKLAKAVQDDYPSYSLSEAIAKIEEKQLPTISQLTRHRIAAAIESVSLSGRVSDFDLVEGLWPIKSMLPPENSTLPNMHDYLAAYGFLHNSILNKRVLEHLGVYTCSQAQFFKLIEAVADPLVLDQSAQTELVSQLNSQLLLDGYELRSASVVSGRPLYKLGMTRKGASPSDESISRTLEAFDPAEIHSRWEEALKRRASDPRAAITLARTLLEDTCKWVIHASGATWKDDDDLPTLYRSLSRILYLAPDQHTEQVFKQILGSCQSIIEALGSIRNKLGDAHSQGPVRAKPQTRHAELAVNLAGTMATFLIATWEARSEGQARS